MKTSIRLKRKERLSLFTDLSTMLTAGIPILEAIDSLREDARGNLQQVLRALHEALANGEPLSLGMERLPLAFDAITINLIRAAEAGGTLEKTLIDIVQTTKKELAFTDTIRATMIYPAFVMVVFLGIVILMLTFVIPRVTKVFTSMRVHIPPVTRAMMDASAFFTQHWLFIGVGLAAFCVIAAAVVLVQRRAIIRLLLGLPGLRTLGRNIDLTRFTRSFGLLMHAGVPLMEALELSTRVMQKKQLIAMVGQMRINVESGKELSHGLRAQKALIPPMMARSLETAETSGTLEKTLQQLAEYFDDQVGQSLKIISSLVEPVLLVVVGLLVGTLMITIIAPIYNLISQVKPG